MSAATDWLTPSVSGADPLRPIVPELDGPGTELTSVMDFMRIPQTAKRMSCSQTFFFPFRQDFGQVALAVEEATALCPRKGRRARCTRHPVID